MLPLGLLKATSFALCMALTTADACVAEVKQPLPWRSEQGASQQPLVISADDGVKDKKYTAYPRVEEDNIINYGVVNPLDFKLFGVCVESCPKLEDVLCQEVSPAPVVTAALW